MRARETERCAYRKGRPRLDLTSTRLIVVGAQPHRVEQTLQIVGAIIRDLDRAALSAAAQIHLGRQTVAQSILHALEGRRERSTACATRSRLGRARGPRAVAT